MRITCAPEHAPLFENLGFELESKPAPGSRWVDLTDEEANYAHGVGLQRLCDAFDEAGNVRAATLDAEAWARENQPAGDLRALVQQFDLLLPSHA